MESTINFNLFYGKRIRLTGSKQEDNEIMNRWQEDSEYLRNVDTEYAYPKPIEVFSEDKCNSNEVSFRIRTIEDDLLIGFVTIHSIEWNNRTGTLAIGIGESVNRNKGYGTEVLQLILRYAFHELNLDRVGLEVIDYNNSGIRAYEKVGFIQEGRKRSVVYRDGKRFDCLVMGILRSDWELTKIKNPN